MTSAETCERSVSGVEAGLSSRGPLRARESRYAALAGHGHLRRMGRRGILVGGHSASKVRGKVTFGPGRRFTRVPASPGRLISCGHTGLRSVEW